MAEQEQEAARRETAAAQAGLGTTAAEPMTKAGADGASAAAAPINGDQPGAPSNDQVSAAVADAEPVVPPDDMLTPIAGSDEPLSPADGEDSAEEGEEYVEESVVVVRRPVFIAGVIIAALLLGGLIAANIVQYKRADAAVATVNGTSISRKKYDQEVARQSGSDVLDSMITNVLVDQDAAKRHITVSTDEVDAKLKDVKAQFGSDTEYQQQLQQSHLTEPELRDRIRRSLVEAKLVADKVQVSDSDIQQFFDQNKDTQFKGKSLDDVKTTIKDQLTQSKQQDALTGYLADLRTKAKISRALPGA